MIGADIEPLRKNLRGLNDIAKSMDPSRMTTIAQVTGTPMDSEHNYITDVVSYNHYFGWYGGSVSHNGPWLDAFHKLNLDTPLGVSEHNAEYTLPDIAAAMAADNWFDDIADNDEIDEIEVIDGYYSLEDTLAELIGNEECHKIMKGWLMANGNLTLAFMLPAVVGMVGNMRLSDTSTIGGTMLGDITQKDLAKLNRMLNKVKKIKSSLLY